MKIGLYFGTFNPIHIGHLVIANYMVQFTELQKIWFVVSPKNPFKQKQSLLKDHHRIALVREGIEGNPNFHASDIEFGLPIPSYTVNTLAHLREKYPNDEFALIMGEDNLRGFHKWKNHKEIIAHHELYVYPRAVIEEKDKTEFNYPFKNHPKVHYADAPVMNISASFIRNTIKQGKSVQYLLSPPVHKYLTEMHFYEK